MDEEGRAEGNELEVAGTVGDCDGALEDIKEGSIEGTLVTGRTVGSVDGITLGDNDGRTEGFFEGIFEGIVVGDEDGTAVVGGLDGEFDRV
eukprot:CAMPEP_0170079386 /NCGR_PEP_ID=MMETSP0019_2-20121128/15779_1 /TAXON_ID=98059 /ORGANISM="Dinobryon sp., Strain UTEXLB2267" /LENGTH=90 /DNA_ID=CAMNT_0010292815 /DNA_START=432 /DNA_END=705 /DNA_ORIENTATION=+